MISPKKIKYLVGVAEDVIKSASKIVKKDLTNLKKAESDVERDIKIVADKKLSTLIIEHLRKKSPYPILSEEDGVIRGKGSSGGYRWIVDPLDGSFNFSRGIPMCAISIALWQGTKPVFGLVHNVYNNETFTGIVNKGAWLNNRSIKVGKLKDRSKAVLCTGFPISSDFTKEHLLGFVKHVQEFKKIRMIGSAALSLAYVACNRSDYYHENNIKLWDIAAGLALIEAAGGKFKITPSPKKRNTYIVSASNKALLGKGN